MRAQLCEFCSQLSLETPKVLLAALKVLMDVTRPIRQLLTGQGQKR